MKIPEKIGRYVIVKELGRGGMAVVFLAHDPFMDRHVALKLMPRQLTVNDDLRARFQREARIVASLEHPAIVPVHDFGEFNEQPYLVMRYMTGGSLKDLLVDGPLSLSEVVRILHPVSQALDKAHTKHIIHRDLKPDNILFDGDKNPYLSDFGIARLAEGTQTQSIMGTPAYMSPEQIKGDVELDGRSDIYALGVILFEMLSGRQPFTAETPTQIMMKHVLDPVPNILELDEDLPPMTQVIVEQAMAKDREDRFDTAEALVNALEDLLTSSQKQALEAALPGTIQQQTMLEVPDFAPGPAATVVEDHPEAAAAKKPSKVEGLFTRIQTADRQQDWVTVLALGAQIHEIQPGYRDVDSLVARAKSQLTQPGQAVPLSPVSVPEEDIRVEAQKPGKEADPDKKKRSPMLLLIIIGIIFVCITLSCIVLYLIGTAGDPVEEEPVSGIDASSGGDAVPGSGSSGIAAEAGSSASELHQFQDFPDEFPEEEFDGDPAVGEELFISYGCAACHGFMDDESSAAVGPWLGDFLSYGDYQVVELAAEEYLYQSILDPSEFIVPECPDGPCAGPPSLCPETYRQRMGENPQDLYDVMVYILTQ